MGRIPTLKCWGIQESEEEFQTVPCIFEWPGSLWKERQVLCQDRGEKTWKKNYIYIYMADYGGVALGHIYKLKGKSWEGEIEEKDESG